VDRVDIRVFALWTCGYTRNYRGESLAGGRNTNKQHKISKAWVSTGELVTLTDRAKRTIYTNAKGDLRIKKMIPSDGGKRVATYIKYKAIKKT
jgi:hypothetical protein